MGITTAGFYCTIVYIVLHVHLYTSSHVLKKKKNDKSSTVGGHDLLCFNVHKI